MKRYIKNFELLKKYQDRKIKPFKVNFQPGLNVIVGDNGSGKSTLIHLLTMDNDEYHTIGRVKKCPRYMHFDTETMNPRISDLASSSSGNYIYTALSHFQSHGEVLLPIMLHCTKEKNKIFLLDEPESGISLKNQVKMFNAFMEAVENGCQIFVATHSYVIIKKCEKVFCLNKKAWTSSEAYLKKNVK